MRSGEEIYPGDTIHVPAESYAALIDEKERYKSLAEGYREALEEIRDLDTIREDPRTRRGVTPRDLKDIARKALAPLANDDQERK